jgi:hypothetical protein
LHAKQQAQLVNDALAIEAESSGDSKEWQPKLKHRYFQSQLQTEQSQLGIKSW